jgi:peptide subunit release factor 1 (eRF1)
MLPRMGSFNVALLEALLSAGVSHERARTVVDLFDKSVDERYGLHAQVLATKRDLAELETRLAKDIAQTNTRIAETKSELIKWVLGALTAQTALLLGAMKLL